MSDLTPPSGSDAVPSASPLHAGKPPVPPKSSANEPTPTLPVPVLPAAKPTSKTNGREPTPILSKLSEGRIRAERPDVRVKPQRIWIARMFINNWQVKIVSLIFATALWFYTAGQVRVTTTLPVKVDETSVRGLPSDHRVATITPSEFSIEVSGPASLLRSLRDAPVLPRLELNTRALEDGRQVFPITTTMLGIDAELHILATNPANIDAITLTIGRVESREVWVEPPRLIDVPDGIQPALTLDRNRVMVSGAVQTLAEFGADHPRLRFKPVSLGGVDTLITGPDELRVLLQPDVPDGVVVGEVSARIALTPVDVRRQQIAVPVTILASPDILAGHDVVLAQPQVVLSVQGPSHLVDDLDPASVLAFVDLRRVGDLNRIREEPLIIHAPSWLRVEPVSVGVTVMPSAARALPAPVEMVPEEP